MDAKPLTEKGPLKHFTYRDIFYLVGAVATSLITITLTYAMFEQRVSVNEKDLSKLIAHIETHDDKLGVRLDGIDNRITAIDHTGTIASKNGIYAESAASKDNARRLEALQQKWEDVIVKIERIDTNVQGLMKKVEEREVRDTGKP